MQRGMKFDVSDYVSYFMLPFFFQAEDGIRDLYVTGVQTCALPISAYGFGRNQSLLGNTVSGQQIVANPNLSYTQAGASVSGPLVHDKLFFFVNGEIVRSDDPGSDFAASVNGSSGLGISRVDSKIMDSIRTRMIN